MNADAPAVFETPMNAQAAPEVLERLVSLIPMQRLGGQQSLQRSWHGLSDECSFSTGAVYGISGGRETC